MVRKNIAVFGPLGAGKSTSLSLISNPNYISISSGKLIRSSGLDVKNGNLISDEIVISLICDEMEKTNKNIFHDGFPRTLNQAKSFYNLGYSFDYAFYFKLPKNISVKRSLSRTVCSNPLCQATYNLNSHKEGFCNFCGSPLISRPDDNINAIQKRYDIFQKHLNSIINFFKEKNVPIIEIDAQKSPEETSKIILETLKEG